MAKVICRLPNTGDVINGVKFTPCEDGVISEEIGDEQAAYFASIPGYELVVEKKTGTKLPATPKVTPPKPKAAAAPKSTGVKSSSASKKSETKNDAQTPAPTEPETSVGSADVANEAEKSGDTEALNEETKDPEKTEEESKLF